MTAQQIIAEWNSKTQEQQENYCKAAVATALNGLYHLNPGYTFEDASQETFLRVLEAMQDPEAIDADSEEWTAAGKASNTLSAIVHRAARAGLARMAYQSRTHSKASNYQATSEDGDVIDILYLLAADDNTERAAIIRVTIQDFIKSLVPS